MKSCIDFYDDSAQSWADEWYENEQLLPYLKEFIKLINHDYPKVLDLCCGAGYESMRLNRLGANVIGADLSEKSLEIAREKNPTLKFYKKDMLKSYADLGEFDGVVCIAGIVHIKAGDLDKVFGNMYEVLKENGILLLVFKNGIGEKLTSTFNNKIYARNFVYHTKEEIAK